MAPGQILIEFVIPIASVAATILGAFVVKKRRDKKKAEACRAFDITDARSRIELLEHKLTACIETICVNEAASKSHLASEIQEVFSQTRSSIDGLRAEFQTLIADATNSLRNDLENKMVDSAKKIVADSESDVELDMSDVRKEINKKLQEYDLAITKWVGKKMEHYQPVMKVPDTAALFLTDGIHIPQHGVVEDDPCVDYEPPDVDIDT